MEGTPFEETFTRDRLDNLSFRAFQRHKDEDTTDLLSCIEKYGYDRNLAEGPYNVWTSRGHIWFIKFFSNNPEFDSYLLIYEDTDNKFNSSDVGSDMYSVFCTSSDDVNSLRKRLSFNGCGLIKIEWIDDSENPRFANYHVPTQEESIEEDRRKFLFHLDIFEIMWTSRELQALLAPDSFNTLNLNEINKIIKNFEPELKLGYEINNLQDLIKTCEDLISRISNLLPEEPEELADQPGIRILTQEYIDRERLKHFMAQLDEMRKIANISEP